MAAEEAQVSFEKELEDELLQRERDEGRCLPRDKGLTLSVEQTRRLEGLLSVLKRHIRTNEGGDGMRTVHALERQLMQIAYEGAVPAEVAEAVRTRHFDEIQF